MAAIATIVRSKISGRGAMCLLFRQTKFGIRRITRVKWSTGTRLVLLDAYKQLHFLVITGPAGQFRAFICFKVNSIPHQPLAGRLSSLICRNGGGLFIQLSEATDRANQCPYGMFSTSSGSVMSEFRQNQAAGIPLASYWFCSKYRCV
jgi:hypothetical protein